jgi:hypothetical protein
MPDVYFRKRDFCWGIFNSLFEGLEALKWRACPLKFSIFCLLLFLWVLDFFLFLFSFLCIFGFNGLSPFRLCHTSQNCWLRFLVITFVVTETESWH